MASEDTRGGAEGASASLQAGREHRLPPALAPVRRAPSLPASRTGLPDEAFESLTQLQHIYVAHNKVSALPRGTPPQAQAGRQGRSRLGPEALRGGGRQGRCRTVGTRPTAAVPLQLSVAPQFLPRSLRVADLAANEVTEIFPLTFGEKPALRYSPWPSPGPAGSCIGLGSVTLHPGV